METELADIQEIFKHVLEPYIKSTTNKSQSDGLQKTYDWVTQTLSSCIEAYRSGKSDKIAALKGDFKQLFAELDKLHREATILLEEKP